MTGLACRPALHLEQELYRQGFAPVCGVDEVGRGPLAGPVVAAAVILPFWQWETMPLALTQINDSKQLTGERRRSLLGVIQESALAVAIGEATPTEIDALNIRGATLLAMSRAIALLELSVQAYVLVDGRDLPSALPCQGRAIIRGDQTSLSIAAASIVAKEYRDAHMVQLAQQHPGYGWEQNSGYPTAAHRQALLTLGVTAQHRRSFGPVRAALASESINEPRLFDL
ncbi:ribonuclease HII [Candidatus Magnetaquicoccus inordinatus]|uniref:ribonuclease HII n=1 Tax=Candidatus Magnetaquicoccus inordinatus TaxID=2496818 RepID=UPI00102BE8E9|nr:ribonuclease HII [Candidatus Magnetaquicoccus inordinatus]